MRTCGNCGLPGHNRRTCEDLPVPTKPSPKKKKALKRKKKSNRRCGVCSETDHDARNCPNKASIARKQAKANKEAERLASLAADRSESPDYVLPHMVSRGGRYWAPFGDVKWSAVIVTSTNRTWCRATRVKPTTGETVASNARVRRDELVKRLEDLSGADRPSDPPTTVFESVRAHRERTRSAGPEQDDTPEVDEDRAVTEPRVRKDMKPEQVKAMWVETMLRCGAERAEAEKAWAQLDHNW